MSALTTTCFPPPVDSTAPAPAEYRGLARDAVRLQVASPDEIHHVRFRDLTSHLRAGDLLVVNDSATVNAEVDGELAGRGAVVIHVASLLDNGNRVVELRTAPDASRSILDAMPGAVATSGPVQLTLLAPYPQENSSPTGVGNRLWQAHVDGALDVHLRRHGRPIAYGYLDRRYSLGAYQTIFGIHPGSAEMPSAGRPFTTRLLAELVARGIRVAPITLHTGVSSQEVGEGPQPEWFEVPTPSASLINHTRAEGGRVIAVGTTATRAVESAVRDGLAVAVRGWTERVVTPSDPPQLVNGLITGWHDPAASHLQLVEAVAGAALTQHAYDAARERGYLWHEFGDSALLLP